MFFDSHFPEVLLLACELTNKELLTFIILLRATQMLDSIMVIALGFVLNEWHESLSNKGKCPACRSYF